MAKQVPGGPTVMRLILGRQLQALREKAGLSHEQASDAIYTSAWTIRRMEKAEVGLKLNYADVLPSWFRVFPGLEQAAELIRGYEPHCVPGLLQTEDYAHALTIAGYPDALAEETSRRVAVRMARQQILTRPDPPQLWEVIDETV